MSPRKAEGVYVALLRGINLGARNKLPMKDLVPMLEGAGCSDVQTYIQSGNAVFCATEAKASRVPSLVAKAIADRLGFKAPLLLRTARELQAVARGNPFLKAGADPEALYVVFLEDQPPPAKVAALDPSRSVPDEFRVRGREIYLHCPSGFGRTKLSNAYFETKLGAISTVRNWRTVLKLAEMAGSA